ncbi:hypothetical protein DFH27DRAFT_618853 [Peziza echinospora]|nr:hypothetical protein DFH27DRAFT_618853 [Peziza echinospora]
MVAHARVQAAHSQPPMWRLLEWFLEEFNIVTFMRHSNNYQHSNPQARKTNTP